MAGYSGTPLENCAAHFVAPENLHGAECVGFGDWVACFGLIAAWAMNELSYDRFHEKQQRIFRIAGKVTTDSKTFDQAVTSPPMAEALMQDYPEVENAVRLDMNGCIVRYGDKQFLEDGVLATDRSFFYSLQPLFFDLAGKEIDPLFSRDLLALLAGIGVVKSQMDFIRSKDLGFKKEELLVLDVNGFAEVRNGIQPFRGELLSNAAAKGVAVSRGLIVSGLGNSHIGWWVFILAGGLALIIALLTVSTQALKAALANPVEALRYE